jgi:5-methylcytosine-specific restriction enzyme A|uniref:MrcB family domain-containing protein n=2 Tax=Algoriphagus sp. TaxID=1872435 RepID=UPI0040479ACF
MIRDNLISFFNSWSLDSDTARHILSENKEFNAKLKAGKISGKSYPEDKKIYSLYELSSAEVLSKSIPFQLYKKAGIPEKKYKIQGSIGQGNPAEIPWICVFDLDITSSAQDGFYIVYLFKSDMSGVYLSLNQGWTQYERQFGVKEGRAEISKNSKYAKSLLKSDQGFSYDLIDLKATKSLGKGYELGNICSVYYSADSIPSEVEIINDLRNLIGVYRELKGVVGSEILDIQGNLDEDIFQEELQKGKRKELGIGAIPKKNKRETSTNSSWVRDANISYTALDNANFKCENDENHVTFISDKTGNQFVEAHHLIPMEFQGEFEVSIDVPENIISLCPNCHRAFHNSEKGYKESLISKFYDSRKYLLRKRSLIIEKDKLYQYYKTTPNNT